MIQKNHKDTGQRKGKMREDQEKNQHPEGF